MTERIKRLKERLFEMDGRTVFLERLTLMRQGYEKYRDESPSVRYALILDEILSGMSIVIDTDDLIAGRVKETIPTNEEEAVIEDIAAYYEEVCPKAVMAHEVGVEDWAFRGRLPPQSRDPFRNASMPSWFNTDGHITVSWETLLSKGMSGVRETAEKKAARIKETDPDSAKKLEFLEAVIVSCDAVIKFAGRYVEKLKELAGNEKDEGIRKELQELGDTLKRVPSHPARCFREALQSVWFLDFIMHQACGSRDYTPGRMDQYLYSYYKKDIEQGVLTESQAIELLQNFFIHTVEISGISDHTHGAAGYEYTSTAPAKRSLCKDSVQYLVLAGQTPDGNDACNDLSLIILDAIDEVRTKSPAIIVRYHESINRDFWLKTCDLMRRNFNNIGIYNDAPVIEAMVNGGVMPEDAINYSHYGCCNPAIPGKDAQLREDQRNLTKILELTLNDGFDPIAKIQRGPHTGEVGEFKTFDQLMAAYKIQMGEDIVRSIDRHEERFKSRIADKPFSFESCLLEGCVETATDCNDPKRNPAFGGPGYIHFDIHGGGLATTADSLAAIRKIVYEKNEISLSELKNALDKNFDGNEMLRLKLINKHPKFGNDDDYVDSIAAEIGNSFCTQVISHGSKRPALGLCWPTLYSYHRYRSCGLETGATPDGRMAFEPVSENQSPVNGRDNKGISALINSLSKLNSAFKMTSGGGLTINIHPTALMVEDGAKVIADLYETYFEKGGLYIQLNVIDRETLIEAKKHPERHRELLVRVTGYSAYFVTLSPESQDNIIARYAHSA
jgi:pyruvate-formate lyase